MLSVVMLNGIMLSVMAPSNYNDTQHNSIQYDNTRFNNGMALSITTNKQIITLTARIMTLSITAA